jgi:regulator of replication initiation timing
MAFNKQEVMLFEAALDVIKERQEVETKWCNTVDKNNALERDNENLKIELERMCVDNVRLMDENDRLKNRVGLPEMDMPGLVKFTKYWRNRGFRVIRNDNEEHELVEVVVTKHYPIVKEGGDG